MIPVDTFDSVILRSAFSKILHTKGFQFMSYALSGTALIVASVASYEILTKSKILPELTGPVLAVVIVSSSLHMHLLGKILGKILKFEQNSSF